MVRFLPKKNHKITRNLFDGGYSYFFFMQIIIHAKVLQSTVLYVSGVSRGGAQGAL